MYSKLKEDSRENSYPEKIKIKIIRSVMIALRKTRQQGGYSPNCQPDTCHGIRFGTHAFFAQLWQLFYVQYSSCSAPLSHFCESPLGLRYSNTENRFPSRHFMKKSR